MARLRYTSRFASPQRTPPFSGRLARIALGEQSAHYVLAVAEDSLKLSPHQRMYRIAENTKRESIAHLIFDEGFSGRDFCEGVRVDPLRVWAAKLLVDELVRRVPSGDARAPTHGESVQLYGIVNQGARSHLYR